MIRVLPSTPGTACPGALVAWFLDTVGLRGILDMAAGITDRRATATAVARLR